MSVEAVRVHRIVTGPPGAPVVVLANSLGSTLRIWDGQVAALAARYRVVRYDLRGHGGSPAPDGPYSIAGLGADLLALLDDLGVDRASLAGVSIGGMIAMWVAAHAPERVDGLIVTTTSARLEPPTGYDRRAQLVLAEGMGAVADAVVARWLTPPFAAREPRLVEDLRAMVRSVTPVGYAGCCLAIDRMDLREELRAITAPALAIAAADDPAIPPAHVEAIARSVRGCRLVTIPGAAHIPGLERPALLSTLMLEHLDAVTERSHA